jgi:hypothetical protein
VHADDDDRSPAPLDGLGDILPDALERVDDPMLNLGREDLEVHTRQLLGQQLAPGRLLPGVCSDLLGRGRRGIVSR